MSFAKSRSLTEFNSAVSVAMSILNYFRREKRQQEEFLPSPSDFSSDLSSSVRAANLLLLLANLRRPSEERLENVTIIAPRSVHLLGIIRLSMDLNVLRQCVNVIFV